MLSDGMPGESADPRLSRPAARGDLSLQEIGEEGVLYDREAGMVHILNRTALFVWKQCDRRRTVGDIAHAVEQAFSDCRSVDIRRDVLQILGDFAKRGLLEAE